MKVIVKDSQNIYDIAIQYYGSVEAVPLLLEDNNLKPDQTVDKGTELIIQEEKIFDKTVISIFKRDGIIVATGEEPEIGNFIITEIGEYLVDEEDNYLMYE